MRKLYHYPRPSSAFPAHKSYCGADGMCDAVFANCPECFSVAAAERQSPNPVLALFQSMGRAYIEAEEARAEAARETTRGEPGAAPPIVVDEDVAARVPAVTGKPGAKA